jgi:DNA-binding SARP family transcriptional activator/ABC-type transport system substrate-binding protein
MEFGLLGPLEARQGDSVVSIGGPKQRALLALLLLHANEVVSRERLIEELWPERPRDRDHSLDHHISRLRRALGEPSLIATRGGGYVLDVAPDCIDAHRFEQILEEGKRANADGDPAAALERLREALALWRGNAFADLAYEPFARVESERLEELRLLALEERIDAELALGVAAALVPELESLAARHPLRERIRAQLMLALYRSGRQADALRVYADARQTLAGDLGLEPGPELRQLEQAILRHDPSLLAAAARRARRRRGRIAASIPVAAAAAAVGLLLADGGTPSSHAGSLAQPQSVALLADSSGRIVAQASVQAPAFSRFGDRALWTLSQLGILTKIDPVSARVEATVNTGAAVPCGLAAGGGSVWVTDCSSPTLVRVDARRALVVDRIVLPDERDLTGVDTGDVTLGAGSVWVARGFANPSWVERLDLRGRRIARILIAEGGAQHLAFTAGALWVSGEAPAASVPSLSKIDPATNHVVATVESLRNVVCCVAAGGGFAWAATRDDHTVWKIAEDGTVIGSTKLPADAESLSYADGAVWAAAGDSGMLVRIDPTTGAARDYRLGHRLVGVAARDGSIAVGVQPAGADVTAGLHGRIVRIALKDDYLDWTSTDPVATQYAFNQWQVQLHYATCAKLFTYPDASGAAGASLVPEVAAGWPSITDGGRTYTFRIKSGFRFSSGEAVTAESFRHELERYLSPKEPGPWHLAYLSDVVGAKAYNAGRAEHLSGVSAHGNTLVIRLRRPAGDLASRLAEPSFCAVPRDLPMIPNGLPYAVPSAGPYYLAEHAANVVVLKPNPYYHGPRPRRVDAIVYRMHVDPAEAAALVAAGKVDYVEEADPALGPRTDAARGAGSRYRLTRNNWTEGLALNTRRPLFRAARARRTVAYALDRTSLADALGSSVPSSHILAPGTPGYRDRPGYPLHGTPVGKLHRARAVLAVAADDNGAAYDPAVVDRIRRQLAAVGITVKVWAIPQSDLNDPRKRPRLLARADLTRIEGNAETTRDPVAELLELPYLPGAARATLERIATIPSPRRELAAAAVAARLEQDADDIGFADRVTPELVSSRLGCLVEQPVYPGLDLAALCLRPSARRR